MRRASKVDANQPEIVAALRKAGATVQHLHAVGQGCPDILVGWRGLTVLMELKDGSKPASARKLTPDQVRWRKEWNGGPIYTVTCSGAAIRLLSAMVAAGRQLEPLVSLSATGGAANE